MSIIKAIRRQIQLWRLRRYSKYITRSISSTPKEGLLVVADGVILCCYEIDDEAAWKYVDAMRDSIKKVSEDL